jgi:glycosyltransferase involved in cell wall biosynthesis
MNTPTTRPRILVLAEWYLPGWKAGGPIRSLANLVAALSDRFEIRIITQDRDHGDTKPFDGVVFDEWTEVGEAAVFYGRPATLKWRSLRRIIRETAPDLVVLTGLFSILTIRYLFLRRLRRIDPTPAVILPQGQFDTDALALKSVKKRVFIRLAKIIGLTNGVDWQATTPAEAKRVRAVFPGTHPYVASDLPAKPPPQPLPVLPKQAGSCSLVSLARISPMKNLPFIVERLSTLHGEVELTLYGHREAEEWSRVDTVIGSLPANVRVTYGGVLQHNEVSDALAQSHFSVLPTLGENFGHAIYESLCAGRPAVISDRTPWRNLTAEGAGWDLALEDPESWGQTLQHCVDMDEAAYRELVDSTHAFAVRWFAESDLDQQQADVFDQLLG